MWSPAEEVNQLTILDPAAAVLAEYMWLSGERDEAWVSRFLEVLEIGVSIGTPWPSGALAFWMWKLGYLESSPEGTADFYGWIIDGQPELAVDFWGSKGIPYDQALALMHGDESQEVEALQIFEELGAADHVRNSLVDRGVKVARGRSRTTRVLRGNARPLERPRSVGPR